ncbi:MAG TPA: hypothetical protein VH138_15100 [Vicinamibacterales bacterium]|nr:hypothetical protein [Vicinamibacterales bacterium]
MVRGFLATTAAAALALGVNLFAFDSQHGNSGQHGNSAAAHSGQTTSNGQSASTASHGNSSPKSTGAPTSTKTTTSSTGTTTLSPVQQKLTTQTQLANKLQTLLPSGTNVVTAAGGFRNLGQFVAAVHVSHNLGIPFSQLKTDMVTKNMSLGRSIQTLRPSVNSTQEVERAETQTKRMMESGTDK